MRAHTQKTAPNGRVMVRPVPTERDDRFGAWLVLASVAGAAALGTLAVVGLTSFGMRYGFLAGVLAVAALTDGRRGIIPNRLIVLALLAALGFHAVQGTLLREALPAGGVAFGVLIGIRGGSRIVFGRVGLGMGDVKLGFVLALFLGWSAFWALYLAAALGAAFGGVGLVAGGLDRSTRLPFAPFVALGTLLHFLIPFPF